MFGGYGYEMNDDDRSLTSYHTYRVGGSFRGPKDLTAKVEYATRSKKDEEKLTLLQDVEAATFRREAPGEPRRRISSSARATRTGSASSPISASSREGQAANVFGRYSYGGGGASASSTRTRTTSTTTVTAAVSTPKSHIVTGRAYFERIKNLRLGGGVTYLDVGKDLDIEKSIVFLEAMYTILNDYHVEVKYNVYNYDDYLVLDRYYTANVVWINVAYDFDFQNE